MALRLVFMGTPDFSVPTLRALVDAGHEIAAVYTQPPRPAGRRGLDLTRSPVHLEADRLGLDVRTPASLRDAAEQQAFAALGADAAVVVAYGLLLPNPVLKAPRLGAWNGHASALPRWRGAAPIQRAIMAGDSSTAMMVMRMEEGLDTGPVALLKPAPILPDMTAGDLHDQLARECAALMVEAMRQLERGDLVARPQAKDGVTYARKIAKEETRIDWSRPAEAVHDHIRGLSPFPGAWSELDAGGRLERVKILRTTLAAGRGEPGVILDGGLTVACGSGAIRLLELQRAGGRPLAAEDFARGMKRIEKARFT